jgi:hypothetical protein
MMRSASKNICSVRHRPMPSAPKRRACGVVPACRHWRGPSVYGSNRPSPSGWRNRPSVPARASARCPLNTCPLAPSMVMISPRLSVTPPHGHRAFRDVDLERARAGHAGPAHAARHHGRVARHAAARRENALGRMHAVNVFRARLVRTRITSRLSAASFSASSAVNAISPVAAPGDAQARSRCIAWAHAGSSVGCRIWSSADGSTRPPRSFVDQPLAHHVDRDLERRFCRALAGARLQHEQLAFLHREFDVLHVAVMRFETLRDAMSSQTPPASLLPSKASCRRCVRARFSRSAAACGCRRRHLRPAR